MKLLQESQLTQISGAGFMADNNLKTWGDYMDLMKSFGLDGGSDGSGLPLPFDSHGNFVSDVLEARNQYQQQHAKVA